MLVGVSDATCYNCGRRNPGLWGYAPVLRALGGDMGFVPFVIGGCVVVFGLTLVFSRGNIGMGGLLSLLSPTPQALFLFGASGALPVFGLGRWWTVLSAAWLHGSLLHIVFNMLGVRQLAPAIAELYGPGRMIIIYTMAGIAGFALSSFAGAYIPDLLILRGGRFTVGASASIFGLLGAIVYYGRRSGSRHISSQAWSYTLSMGILGFFPGLGVDNWAHIGGFAGGYLASRVLDPLSPERVDHMAIAVVCLLLSVVSVVASVINGVQFFG